MRGKLPKGLQEAAELYVGCVSGAMQESEYLGIIHALGFEQVTVQKRKLITLPDDILVRHLSADEIASFKAGGTGIFSITVAAKKAGAAKEACCIPNAEGTAKVKVATGEPCGCGVNSNCC
jgi:hypothetical protein